MADAAEILRALDAHVLESTREMRGLRDDLTRLYGRDEEGRLRVAPAGDGRPAPIPGEPWTPRAVTSVMDRLGDLLNGEPRLKKRRR